MLSLGASTVPKAAGKGPVAWNAFRPSLSLGSPRPAAGRGAQWEFTMSRKAFATVFSLFTVLAIGVSVQAQSGSGTGSGGGSAPPPIPSDAVSVDFSDLVGSARNTGDALKMVDAVLGETEYVDSTGIVREDDSLLVASFNVWDGSRSGIEHSGRLSFYLRGTVIELAVVEEVKFHADQTASVTFDMASRHDPEFAVNARYEIAADGEVFEQSFTHPPIPETGSPGFGCRLGCHLQWFTGMAKLVWKCVFLQYFQSLFGGPVASVGECYSQGTSQLKKGLMECLDRC